MKWRVVFNSSSDMMMFKFWLLSLILVVILVFEVRCQEKFDILAEKNEIPYEKDDKTKILKSSSKPVLVVKESKYETKTSTSDIKKLTSDAQITRQRLDTHPVSIKKASSVESFIPDNPVTPEVLPDLVCPHKDAPKPLFSLPCFTTANCGLLGKDMMCCDGRCLKGIKTKPDLHHEPIFFGIIERKCPVDHLTEMSEVKECFTDDECSPRICCGETLPSGEKARYCRTPIPEWDTLPLPSPVLEPLKAMTSYMQCTPPPPSHLDLHPKSCQNLMDCFPNLCCQENGKKFCRPPRRSLLALVAELGQRIIPEDVARKFIERIS